LNIRTSDSSDNSNHSGMVSMLCFALGPAACY